ncbi:HEPN domain-containing protein [Pseudomonas citronellolis]|uniref:HEPN domain-containing protein n=1 Tax=Pseudomonas citronellolis TaxID=53408 RepID=UPI0010650348|nr:HEPN domain-containing protein [Pseudomonas humi]
MKRHASLQDTLDATFLRAEKVDLSETELRADLARHLCVLVSGFLDQTIKNFTIEYVKKRASPTITHYISNSITNLTNLKSSKLSSHLLAFDASWKIKVEKLIAEERKDAIDSLVTLRHGIAHGKPGDVTLARVKSYYKEILKVVDEIRIIMQLDDQPPPNP